MDMNEKRIRTVVEQFAEEVKKYLEHLFKQLFYMALVHAAILRRKVILTSWFCLMCLRRRSEWPEKKFLI